MNPLRAIGYFGIVILFLADLVAVIFTLSKHDWYGAVVTVVFLIVLGILAHALRTAAKWEQHPERKANLKLGWFGQSLSAFVLGPVLHTPEGLVLVIGSAISLLFGLLAWFAPSLIALNPARSSISATMFGLWPICAFVFYVKLCAPLFRPSVFTVAVMLVVTCLPFYQAYK